MDESAADSLRGCSPEIQRTVIARGELKTARNPSSALLSRIRDAKSGRGAPPEPGRVSCQIDGLGPVVRSCSCGASSSVHELSLLSRLSLSLLSLLWLPRHGPSAHTGPCTNHSTTWPKSESEQERPLEPLLAV